LALILLINSLTSRAKGKGGYIMSYTEIRVEEVKKGLKKITLNRPDQRNAISLKMVDELNRALSELHHDRSCRVVIMTGEGKGFCAGTDLKEMNEFNKQPNKLEEMWHLQKRISDVIQAMRSIPQPIICAMNGAAAGGGASFVMATDVRVAVPQAKFILSYINVGMTSADMGSSYFLPRLIGMSRASELMLTGRPLMAEEAKSFGLIAMVVEPELLMATALEYADSMLKKSDFGLRLTKEMINSGMDAGSLSNQIHVENRGQCVCSAIGSFDQGTQGFASRK